MRNEIRSTLIFFQKAIKSRQFLFQKKKIMAQEATETL